MMLLYFSRGGEATKGYGRSGVKDKHLLIVEEGRERQITVAAGEVSFFDSKEPKQFRTRF